MLLLPKPTDFAVDFPTVARSVAFGIVFREFTTTLNPMATPRGLEPPTSSVTGWHSTLLNYGAIYKIDFSLNLYVYIILKIYRKIKLFTEKFLAEAVGADPTHHIPAT